MATSSGSKTSSEGAASGPGSPSNVSSVKEMRTEWREEYRKQGGEEYRHEEYRKENREFHRLESREEIREQHGEEYREEYGDENWEQFRVEIREESEEENGEENWEHIRVEIRAESEEENREESNEEQGQMGPGTSQGEEKQETSTNVKHKRRHIGERMLVYLKSNSGEPESVCTVYIDRTGAKPPPNYGGYRSTKSGVHYLNAVAQTESEKKKVKKGGTSQYITRENLKPEQKKAEQQTDREAWTQMDRPGVMLDNRGDYELVPGPYFNSDDWEEVRVEAVIIIQKYVRRSIARRTANRMRAYAKERKEFWEEQERIRKIEAEEHLKFEIQRRMNPRSGDDFEILYTELASWCAQELNKINASGIVGMERRKAIKELLLKEIKLLQTIDRLRCKAARENKRERIAAALTKMSIPKMWELRNGSIVHVRTLGTTRASDLMHLYEALAKPIGTNDERMGVLGYVKWTVQVFSTGLTREIVELIEREADLMMRGRPTKSLSGLRLRILNLFLQFIETPEFNPEAASQQYVPLDFDYGVNSQPTRKSGPG